MGSNTAVVHLAGYVVLQKAILFITGVKHLLQQLPSGAIPLAFVAVFVLHALQQPIIVIALGLRCLCV